jgi:ATP-binding cassette subfamily F protein 3
MAKLNGKKQTIAAQLEDSNIYSDANKEKLKALLLDQAYLVKELSEVEASWLEQQEYLEAVS